MHETDLVQLASIIVLGVAAQYAAQLLRLPSILLLLVTGILVGPVLGMLDPDSLFGERLLMPVVSLSVALILFEGGLTLRFKELPGVGHVLRNLMTVGLVVTWSLAAISARFILGFDWGLSILLGAILVVTGPTVIDPLVRHIKPTAPVGPLLRWEGIVIDPVGALLAVLVFEFLLASDAQHAAVAIAMSLILTVVVGGGLGLLGAVMLQQLIRNRMLADGLENPVAVMLVLAVFTSSNVAQPESGLFAVTVMGIALANQKTVNVGHILEFKENLRVLLISSLFIILAARVDRADLFSAGLIGVGFTLVLIILIRPLAIWLSTIGSPLNRAQRIFLAWMAPRGIVAAAVASVFAIRLEEARPDSGAAELVPVTFVVIVGTVSVYGLTAPWVARRLGIADQKPQGALIVGAHAWGRELARVLKDNGFGVLLVDTNRANTGAARLSGLPAYTGGILTEHALSDIDLSGLGRLIALTPNHEVNALACKRFSEVFGRDEVYQLSRGESKEATTSALAPELRGRRLFAPDVTYGLLASRFAAGAQLRATTLTDEFTYDDYRNHHEGRFIPLFAIDNGALRVLTDDDDTEPQLGQTLISLVDSAALEETGHKDD